MAVSFDGFIAGPNEEVTGLHDWFSPPSGSVSAADARVVEESVDATGAILIGRRAYDLGDRMDGFVYTPYKVEHFVLTHEAPERAASGETAFTFVTDGIDIALEQARTAAGDRNVAVGGGASVVQQALSTGLVDEVQLHLAPMLLGGGIRLFEHPGFGKIRLERTKVVESPFATHLRFRVIKEVSVRKVIVSEFVSLDGVMEDPCWTFRFESEDRDQYKFDELAAADALLLGRVTYEGFAAAWPQMAEETGEYGAWMNGYPKHVVSTTLEEPLEWNAGLVGNDIAGEISALKQQPGKDILVFGSAALVNTLIEHDLVDEYRIMVFPVIVGSGKRLFGDGLDTKVLELVEIKTFASGALVLTYRPAGAEK